MANNQRTIRKPAEVTGLGLFTGAPGKLRLLPAAPGSGVSFVRTDLPGRPRLPVTPATVASKQRRTAVHGENCEIETIEHIMSAIGGLQVDNLELELDAPEVPNGDGSSKPFVEALQGAGIEEQSQPRRSILLREPVSVSDKDVYIVALPSDSGLTVNFTYDYPNSGIRQQQLTIPIDERSYATQ